ncbi:MAG: uroporphyrinogen decarboxylase family protein [bacterium]|nr:uroporphyrinogen decarboxylase family protein [bacterium]
MNLHPYFADLENRIDPADEERLESEWRAFADLKLTEGAFRTARTPRPAAIEWERVLINDALEDDDLMIYRELYSVHEKLESGSGELLSVRSNYGTGIIPTMLGAKLFLVPRENDTLPAPHPLENGQEDIERLLENGGRQPDFSNGLAGKTFRVAERYLELAARYPKVSRYVHYYNPDLQGPLALCEAMWGSDFYYAFYEEPELVHDALDYLTDTFIAFLNRWHRLCPTIDADHCVEWGCLHRGRCIIRNDAAMNISGEMYRSFAMPRDARIIAAFGGGIHFCGRGDHYIEHVGAIDGISCVNLSEPYMNDMEKIYRNTIDKGIIIFGLLQSEVDRALGEGRNLRGRVSAGASAAAWRQEKD